MDAADSPSNDSVRHLRALYSDFRRAATMHLPLWTLIPLANAAAAAFTMQVNYFKARLLLPPPPFLPLSSSPIR